MRRRLVGFGFFIAACAIAFAAQDAVTLKFSPKVGDTIKYKMSASMDAGGGTADVSGEFTDKVTNVDDTSYTVEQTQSNIQVSFNGQQMSQPDNTATTTRKLDGEIADIKSDQESPALWRVAELNNFIYPDHPVKVGDEWTYKVTADEKKGTVAATANYKVDSAEKIGTHDTLKIKTSYKEDGDSSAASSEGFVWIDAKDGEMVKARENWSNVPLGPITATGTVSMDIDE